jgi:hypothetical protein
MELIWGEIAIGLKAVAEEMGHDLANDREVQRCVEVFQTAVRESRQAEPSPCPEWSMAIEHAAHQWAPPYSNNVAPCPGWSPVKAEEPPSHGYWEAGDYPE